MSSVEGNMMNAHDDSHEARSEDCQVRDVWCSDALERLRHIQPALTSDDFEALLAAYVEGQPVEWEIPSDKPPELLRAMLEGSVYTAGGYTWGPFYWAYRKCYAAAIASTALFVGIAAYWICVSSSVRPGIILLMAFAIGCSVAFVPCYRRKALKVAEEALAAEGGSVEAAKERLRQRGGTDFRALHISLLAAVSGFIVIPFLFFVVIPGLG